MINEQLLRQIAEGLINKLVKGAVALETSQKAFVIFGEETTDVLRSRVLEALSKEEFIDDGQIKEKIPQVASCKAIVLVAPSIDLAAKITNLQTDCPMAALVVKALFANKRVIVVASGALAVTDTLRVGLRKAVEDLRCKLVEMGVEFVDLAELAQVIESAVVSEEVLGTRLETEIKVSPNNIVQETIKPSLSVTNFDKQASISHSLPVIVYPISQHPSQIKLMSKDEIGDFVDFLQSKQCTMEKGKPCDRCDMCNTLGF